MAFKNQPGCGCCATGKYCITSAKFYNCHDVTGFTVKFYPGWTTGTTTPADSPEFTATVDSLPFCYSPASTSSAYGLLFQKTGWIDVIVHVGAVSAGELDVTVELAPLAVNVTHDQGSGTMTAKRGSVYPYTGPHDQTTLGVLRPNYLGCFQGTGTDVICPSGSSDPCPTPASGSTAFTLEMQFSSGGRTCGGTTKASLDQRTAAMNCLDDVNNQVTKFVSATCNSDGTFNSPCAGYVFSAVKGIGEWSPTNITDCNPFAPTFSFPSSDPCYLGTPPRLFSTSSALITL